MGQLEKSRESCLLVAEDDSANRNLLVKFLTMDGHCVLEASDGAEAVELFRKNMDSISLCLIDLNLPKLDGFSCIREIRVLSATTPVFILTGENEEDLSDIPSEFASIPRFNKPFNWEALLRIIRDRINT